ncbi:UNVERIFIED_ORG: hypothetical protein EC838_2784 [Providencia alcalifaciens]|jgi:hypothetical protein|nr:hypothetical protein [Providencia rettgeri]
MSWRPDTFLLSTLYTVCGIMFSIGLGLIVTFNMNGVKNKSYINKIRKNLTSVRDSFLIYFVISTTCLVLGQYLNDVDVKFEVKGTVITISPVMLFFSLIIYSIIFFIINFLEVQKLSQDIFDKINQETN